MIICCIYPCVVGWLVRTTHRTSIIYLSQSGVQRHRRHLAVDRHLDLATFMPSLNPQHGHLVSRRRRPTQPFTTRSVGSFKRRRRGLVTVTAYRLCRGRRTGTVATTGRHRATLTTLALPTLLDKLTASWLGVTGHSALLPQQDATSDRIRL